MIKEFMSDKLSLASDNWAPAHPLILESVIQANQGVAPSYGSDPWTEEAQRLIQEAFKRDCKVVMLPTGTGSNVLGLKLCAQSYQSIVCTDIAHIQYQESGAPEFVIGSKLLTVPHQEGKMTPEALLKKLSKERAFGRHSTSPRVVSITQPTEVGTVYTPLELKLLSDLCREENLLFHIDGSRFYNAAAALGLSLSEMLQGVHVDVLSLGGTKNGLMGAEALLIFNSDLQDGIDHLQKQTLQLLSKMRYLSAQYIPFFIHDLWLTLATQSNQKAKEMAALIEATPHLFLSHKVETNQVFFTAPPSWIPLIQEKIFCYLWDKEKNELRWITSWNTSDEEVKQVEAVLTELSSQSL